MSSIIKSFAVFQSLWQQEADREALRVLPCVPSCRCYLLCQTTPRAPRSAVRPPLLRTLLRYSAAAGSCCCVCSRRLSESPSLSFSLCCRLIRPAAPVTAFPEKRHCFPAPNVEGRLKIISGGTIRNVSGQQSIHYVSLLNR